MFIVVDGIDGAGKSTLCFLMQRVLKQFDSIVTKEPTLNSPWATKIREIATAGRESPEKEIEYFHEDRKFHLRNVIEPELKNGKVVICDRYVDSTLAFQAKTTEEADQLFRRFESEIRIPDITFILKCPVEIGLERLRLRDGKNLTKFETKSTLEHARKIYESRTGPNHRFIDASGSSEYTLEQAVETLRLEFDDFVEDNHRSTDLNPSTLEFRYA